MHLVALPTVFFPRAAPYAVRPRSPARARPARSDTERTLLPRLAVPVLRSPAWSARAPTPGWKRERGCGGGGALITWRRPPGSGPHRWSFFISSPTRSHSAALCLLQTVRPWAC
ncbi:hypothetical protein HPB50_017490 [Hyalomma asiaticum]|uniref:Uncharacterized protein n=1 Tax=Hyalomma asiaticum TaxID=266040 RepID=A0ACB7RP75_HYAAI|nr:hypothetical protein HPB50_017490 [Hyalomma asiaticum]